MRLDQGKSHRPPTFRALVHGYGGLQVGRKGRSPGDGGSIAASVRRSADRSLYKIDRLQGDGLMPGRRRGLGA